MFVRSYYYNLVEVLTFDPDTFSFEPRALLATDLGPDDIVFADLDNDGDGDLVTADIEAQGVSVFLWDAGEFAAPQRLPLAEVEELEGLPARGYVIARGGSTLFNLRADAGEAVLEQSGDIGPNSWGRLLAVDEGESMLWYRAPEYGYPNPGGLHVFYALCAGLDRSWTRSELPLWSSGEGHGARSWTFGDVNDDGLGDLSVRESIGMDVVIDWRLIRQ